MTAIHITNLGNFMERFQKALEAQNPSWFVSMANEQELRDFTYATVMTSFRKPSQETISRAADTLKHSVATRLTMPLRAAVHAGLVESKID